MNYQDKIHTWGRISLVLAIGLFISFPLVSSIYFGAWPQPRIVVQGLLAIAPVYWTVGVIEALSFGPMLGSGGAYLGFVTGNLTAMKVPAALQAMEQAGVDAGTPQGEVISTIAIAVSSIVTVIILILGMLMLSALQPILEAPILAPAFANILPALFGGLGVVFISKNWKIAIAPLFMMSALFIIKPALASAVSVLVPVSVLITLAVARLLYKKNII